MRSYTNGHACVRHARTVRYSFENKPTRVRHLAHVLAKRSDAEVDKKIPSRV